MGPSFRKIFLWGEGGQSRRAGAAPPPPRTPRGLAHLAQSRNPE